MVELITHAVSVVWGPSAVEKINPQFFKSCLPLIAHECYVSGVIEGKRDSIKHVLMQTFADEKGCSIKTIGDRVILDSTLVVSKETLKSYVSQE